MKLNAPTAFLTGLLALAPLGTARAMDVLNAEGLAAGCLPAEAHAAPAGTACMMYVRGFIDGAIATDPRVVTNVTREYEEKETFSERAARTRIGSLRDGYEPDESARELVYRVLREHYPCEDGSGPG